MATLSPAPSHQLFELKTNEVLTVAADALSTARIFVLTDQSAQPGSPTSLAASGTATVGPFPSIRYVYVEVQTGQGITASIAPDSRNKLEVVGAADSIRIVVNAGVPDSTVGANTCGPGSLCIDTSNANVYIATGSKSAPTWKLITRAA